LDAYWAESRAEVADEAADETTEPTEEVTLEASLAMEEITEVTIPVALAMALPVAEPTPAAAEERMGRAAGVPVAVAATPAQRALAQLIADPACSESQAC
jgi:hypothetical protein